MNKLLFAFAVAFLAGCSNNENINQANTEKKQNNYVGHIIGYNKYVTSSLIPDSSKNQNYNQLMIEPCFHAECGQNVATSALQVFTSELTADIPAILLVKCGWNLFPINNDITDHIANMPLTTTRYSFKSTKYTSLDSFNITIDTIFPDKSINLLIDNKKFLLKNKDSLTVIDTLQGRNNENYCYRQIIITQKIYNFGIDTISNKSYLQYFMPSY